MSQPERKTLIVVDDEQHNLDLMERSLSPDYDVHAFSNPEEALEKVKDLRPWGLIVDQRMPQLAGTEFIRRCRDLGIDCPALVVTAFPEDRAVVEAHSKELLFQVIQKPFSAQGLNDWVQAALLTARVERVTGRRVRPT